ncbi:MAG: ABC transporter ATP-binding protein [Candidatus Sumerlaeota bacterium]|nr:ABC transporter ATP-binding protein [Candidatus Sumerlaeota bacterium]
MNTVSQEILRTRSTTIDRNVEGVEQEALRVLEARRPPTLATFKRYLRCLIPYWNQAALMIVLQWMWVTVTVFTPWLSKVLIDRAFPEKDWGLFWGIFAANISFALLGRVKNWLASILNQFIHVRVFLDLSANFYRHLSRVSMGFIQSRPVGEHSYRGTADIQGIMALVTEVLPQVFMAAWEFLLMMALLSLIDIRVMLFVLAYAMPYALIAHGLASAERHFYREAARRWQRRDAGLQEGVAGILAVKSFGRRQYEVRKYMKQNVFGYRMAIPQSYMQALQRLVVQGGGLLPWLKGLGVQSWLFYEVLQGRISYGSVVPILAYMNRMSNPVQNIITQIQKMRIGVVPAERLLQTFDIPPVVEDKPGANEMPPIQGDLEFKDVSLSYEKGVWAVRDFTLKVPRGMRVAVVGHSGAGKSSVMAMLLRLYDPTRGQVLVDGIDLRDVRMKSYQTQIGLVMQDTYIFTGTVRDNLMYGNYRATDEQMTAAAKAADIHETLAALPQGYDTNLEEGKRLSSGEKQRLGIARALIRNPNLLLLDEPTSSLDSETEAVICETLRKVSRGRTTFIVSHRFPAIVDADLICVMDGGRIAEVGNHEELMARRGSYYEMYMRYYGLTAEGNGDAA